jgi:hypothetical protein
MFFHISKLAKPKLFIVLCRIQNNIYAKKLESTFFKIIIVLNIKKTKKSK